MASTPAPLSRHLGVAIGEVFPGGSFDAPPRDCTARSPPVKLSGEAASRENPHDAQGQETNSRARVDIHADGCFAGLLIAPPPPSTWPSSGRRSEELIIRGTVQDMTEIMSPE